MVIQPGINPTEIVGVAQSGIESLGVKAGTVKAMTVGTKSGTAIKAGGGFKATMVGLGKTAGGGGTFWSGTGWSLGLGLGLGAWGPLLMTAIGTLVVYKATPMLIKVLAKR